MHKRFSPLMVSLATTGFMSAALPSTAFAQDAVAPAPVADEAGHLGDIIVTARKRAETLQNVPVAVTALDGKFLERQVTTQIDQLTRFTPGLTVPPSSGGSGGGIFLRGVGSIAYSPSISNAVALNFDGVQINTGLPLRVGAFDIAQVEVLRGPQALFFGKNSPGGVMSFRSADPTSRTEVIFRGGYEFYARQRYGEAVISGPVGDGLGMRLAMRYSDQDGYFKVRTTSLPASQTGFGIPVVPSPFTRGPQEHEFSLRGTVKYDAGPLEVRAKGTYNKVGGLGSNGSPEQHTYCPFGVPQSYGTVLSPAANVGNCKADRIDQEGGISPTLLALLVARNPDNYSKVGTGGRRSVTQYIGSLDVKYDIGDALTLNSLSGYYKVKELGGPGIYAPFPVANVISGARVNLDQYTQELRLSSNLDGPINFMVGGFAEKSTVFAETDPALYVAAGAAAPVFPGGEIFDIETKAYSVFGQLSWKIAPTLELSGGLRYSREKKTADVFFNKVQLGALTQDRISFKNTSPEATLSYRPSDEMMLFVSYRQGFKSGGFDAGYGRATALNANQNLSFSYNPEQIKGAEGGFKSTLFDRSLRFNVTGYWYKYTNLQLNTIINTGGGFAFVTSNAAGSKIYGLETELTWKPPVDGLTFNATAAYNHSKYTDFLSSCYGGQSVAQGCDQNVIAGVARAQQLRGRPLSYAPRLSATLGIYYEMDVGGLRLGLSSDSTYQSSQYTDVLQTPASRQPRFIKTDLSVRLFRPDNLWEVSLIGRNLTDKFTLVSTHTTSFTGAGTGTNVVTPADVQGFVSRGREFLLQLTWRPVR